MSTDQKVNILLVDDQPAKLLSYEVILRELGENLIKASSAQEALAQLLKTDVAVVLLDVAMPDLDGFQLASMIREHPRFQKTAIIFVSAIQLAEVDHLRGYEIGAVDYVPVPVVPEVLRAKVKVFIELYRKTRLLETMNDELERRVAERTAELKAYTERLRRSEEARTLALSAGDMGSWELDLETGEYTWDAGQYRIYGVDPETFKPSRKSLRSLIHPDDLHTLPGLTVEGKERYQHEFRVIRPNGEVRWCFGAVAASFDASGAPVRLSGVTVDITERKRAAERQALLAREVDHRAKNALAVVQSILRLTRAPTTPEFVRTVEGRIQALAATHNLLSSTRWEGANLRTLAEEEVAPYLSTEPSRISLDGPSVLVQPATAQAVALVLHELATNAAKYGALSAGHGALRLKWRAERENLVLEWQERGGPPAPAPTALGFGLTIVRSSIEDQLAGSVCLQWRPEGLNCTIKIPRTHVIKVEEMAPDSREVGVNGQRLADGAEAGLRQRRILVVEDEVLISMFLEDVLDDLGATVVGPMTNLKDGLRAIQGESLDGAILDLNLSGEQTYPIADALTARGVPFVFITGYDRESVDRRYGGIPVLQKPIEADMLERVLVKNVLQRVA